MRLELQQRLVQKLTLTPALQQTMKLLQLSRMELRTEVARELTENPCLEEEEAGEAGPETENANGADEAAAPEAAAGEEAPEAEGGEVDLDLYFPQVREENSWYENPEEETRWEQRVGAPESLHDHLRWQLRLSAVGERQHRIGEEVIGNLEDSGYLTVSLEEVLAAEEIKALEPTLEEGEAALALIQSFEPAGVAARDLTECLLIQLRQLGLEDSPVAVLVQEYLPLLKDFNYEETARRMGCSLEDVMRYVDVIKTLNPKPGSSYASAVATVAQPDVAVEKVEGEYRVSIIEDGMPRLRLSGYYRRLWDEHKRTGAKEAVKFIRERFSAARWFLRNIEERKQTILKVAQAIVRRQKDFFEHGVQGLRPMILRDIAEEVGVHESTVSRVVNNKFMDTPRGMLEMKFFFNSALQTDQGEDRSTRIVKETLQRLIDEEPREKPMSDAALQKVLEQDGLRIARRTVAKYREELDIPSSAVRRRQYKAAEARHGAKPAG